MKESQWRSKLIAMRKKTNPNDFIWVMDAKFKSGFPDIYLLAAGKPYHIELKINDYPTKLQESVLYSLANAGAISLCFSLKNDSLVQVSFYDNRFIKHDVFQEDLFYKQWATQRPFMCF